MSSDVTRILSAIQQGDSSAAEKLMPVVYDELRKLAAARLAQEKPGQTLDATALVHEAFLRLVGDQHFDDRGHFFAAAAEAMRRILVDSARRKQRERHGGGRRRLVLDDIDVANHDGNDGALVDLSEALDQLAEANPRAAELVKLRFFAGLTGREAANVLNISPRKADQVWAYARAWLLAHLNETSD